MLHRNFADGIKIALKQVVRQGKLLKDELECSVDYLLCRTENLKLHETHDRDITISPYNDQQLIEIINIYKQLDNVGKAKLLVYSDEMLKRKNEV